MIEYDAKRELISAFGAHPPDTATLLDVASIIAFWSDGDDEPSFCWLLEMKDGQWGAAAGWHDYTGWDCQSGFRLDLYPTREDAIRLGLTDEQRSNLALSVMEAG